MGVWLWVRAVTNARRAWLLLPAVTLGLFVAILLGCLMPVYSGLIAEGYLQHILTTSNPADVNVEITANAVAILPQIVQSETASVDQAARAHVGAFTADANTYLEAWRTLFRISAVNGADPIASGVLPEPDNQGTLLGYDMNEAGPHMRLVAGRLPQDAPPGQPVEVLVTKQMNHVHVGDTLTLSLKDTSGLAVRARVVGIWYPNDENDPFWNGRSFTKAGGNLLPPIPNTYPLVMSTRGFLSALAFSSAISPDGKVTVGPVGMIIHSVYPTVLGRITPETSGTVITQVKSLRTATPIALRGLPGIVESQFNTHLEQILGGVASQTTLLGLPFDIFAMQILGLSLFFAVVVTGILVESQAAHIATLKSRGAGILQLVGGYSAQGLVLAALAALPAIRLAPALALAIVLRLLPAGGHAAQIEQQYLAGTSSTKGSLLLALVAAGLGVVAISGAAWQSARHDVLALRREQGRMATRPFWKRYYLDVGLALLCAAGYVELVTFGGSGAQTTLAQTTGAVSGQASGASGPDPLLFATPSLLLLGGALVALRVFPLLARVAAALVARQRGATGMLAVAQIARAANAARLTLLLTFALGFGLFSLTFQSSLERNSADRAAYITGGDERAQLEEGAPNAAQVPDFIRPLPGVTRLLSLYRTHGSQLIGQLDDANILALDSSQAAAVAYWRADYAQDSLDSLMAQMQAHEQGASAGDSGHPLWALVDTTFAANENVRVGDTFNLASETGTGAITYVVGAVINDFPTMFDGGSLGYLIVDLADYKAALLNPRAGGDTKIWPNEFWLRTTDDSAQEQARDAALSGSISQINVFTSRKRLITQFASDPLQAGMLGLLLLAATTAALLALVGTVAQAILSSGQRTLQFAILRTLGTSVPQVLRMLVAEQAIVFAFGLLGGTMLGILLAVLTLPFLQTSSAHLASAPVGIPPYILVFNPQGSALLYAVLLLAFVGGPLLLTRVAAALRLSKTLRIGED